MKFFISGREFVLITSSVDTDEDKELFRGDHAAMVKHAKMFENETMKLFHIMVKHGEPDKMIRKKLEEYEDIP